MESPFFNVRSNYPISRRVFAALGQWQRAQHVAQWTVEQFGNERALFHYLRIQRRIGFAVQLAGPYAFSESRAIEETTPGHYLFYGFKKHRQPQ